MTDKDAVTDQAAAYLRTVGKRVRLARRTRELTQNQLADAAGVSRSFLSLIEKHGSDLSVLRLWQIADALGVPIIDLLTSNDDR